MRTLDLWGMSAKFDATVPYTWLSGTADCMGQIGPWTLEGTAAVTFYTENSDFLGDTDATYFSGRTTVNGVRAKPRPPS